MKKNLVKKLPTKKPRIPIDNSENRQGKRTGKPGFVRFGTWNIRTLYKPGALQNIIQATNSYRPDIIALQEMIMAMHWQREVRQCNLIL